MDIARRMHRLAAATVVAAALIPAAASAATYGGVSPGPSFAVGSFWQTPLPPDAPLDPRGGTLMTAFNAEITREINAGIGPWISTTSSSTPLYTVPLDQPTVKITLDTGSWGDTLRRQLATGVPIPPGAMPAKGADAHLTIWQPSTDTLWEFWATSRQSDGWHARWGGVMRNVSLSPGHYRDRTDAVGQIIEQANWGATATSLPVIGGTITIDEASRGSIDHALALAIPDACASVFSWPAQRTDGTSTAPDCLPEGARLRLDPRLDLSTLAMPRFTRMLAVAAQRYGIVVRDKTGHATGFFAEDPTRLGSDPWAGTTGTNGLLGGYPWNLVWRQFPWSRLQLLSMSLRR